VLVGSVRSKIKTLVFFSEYFCSFYKNLPIAWLVDSLIKKNFLFILHFTNNFCNNEADVQVFKEHPLMESLEYCRAVYRMGRLNITADGIELLPASDVLVTSVSSSDVKVTFTIIRNVVVTSVVKN
jgi:hypothetical protein